MKIGQLVRYPKSEGSQVPVMLGVITELNPIKDDAHTEIFWLDEDEVGGTITSTWMNEDFEVTSFHDPGVILFIDDLDRTKRDLLMRVVS